MYRLLIVDDEPIVVEGMYQLFKEKCQFELDVCKAYSGVEALHILESTKVDVVLTDIRMPGVSGIELLEKISEYWPSCRVIFLTGYSEFDYVYTAIKKPGVRYILKTESDESILRVVHEALEQVKAENEQRDFINKAKTQIRQITPLLQREFINRILDGDKTYLNTDKAKMFNELNIDLYIDKPMLLMIGQVDFWESELSYIERLEMFYAIDDIFQNYIGKFVLNVSTVYDNSMLVWIIQPDFLKQRFISKDGEIDWKRFVSLIKANVESIQNTIKDAVGVSASFVVGIRTVSIEDISNEFVKLKILMNKISAIGHEMMIADENIADNDLTIKWKDNAIDYMDFSKKLNLLEVYMDKGLENEFENMLKDLLLGDYVVNKKSYLFNMEKHAMVSSLFLSYINRQDIIEDVSNCININSIITIDENGKWEDTVNYFLELGKIICNIKKKDKEKEADIIINRIHKYIQNNIDKDLSLVKIAEVAYFNPSYLSRFYKKETGKNLSEYINEVRLEKAKFMLKDTDLKINEVAMEVGFESPSYFTLFFKRMTKLTPQEYRDSTYESI